MTTIRTSWEGDEDSPQFEQTMSNSWQYQLRLHLTEQTAKTARHDAGSSSLMPLVRILRRHNALLVNQLAAFENYVAEAEKGGVESYPLYKWTKATVENPEKCAKYAQAFTLHVLGDEVYAKEVADALEADLQPLVGGGLIIRMSRYDTNPENSPQMPSQYRS